MKDPSYTSMIFGQPFTRREWITYGVIVFVFIPLLIGAFWLSGGLKNLGAAEPKVEVTANSAPDLDAGEVKWAAHIATKLDMVKPPEYTLFDRSRVDLLTKTQAIEVDWAHKWTEAIGQSLHYSIHTDDRQPVVLLLIPDSSDVRKGRRAYTREDRNKEIAYYLKAVAAGQSRTPKVKVWVYDLRADAFVAGPPELIPPR